MTHMLWDFGNGDKWQNESSSDAISFLIMINEKVHESVARFTTLKSCKKAFSNIISNGSCLTFNKRHYFTSTQRIYKTLKLSVLFSDDLKCLMRVVCGTCFKGVLGWSKLGEAFSCEFSEVSSLEQGPHNALPWTPPKQPLARITLLLDGFPLMTWVEKKRYPCELLIVTSGLSLIPAHLVILSTASRNLLTRIFSTEFSNPWTTTSVFGKNC